MSSLWSCANGRFGFHKPIQVLAHTSFPCTFMNSISSDVNVAIDIDLTRCGGVRPRLKLYKAEERNEIKQLLNIYMGDACEYNELSWQISD